MPPELNSHDWRDRKLQEWLLLLLRYAVTREPSDRSAALAMADELDSLNGQWRPAAPKFFLKTSGDVCSAILAASDQTIIAYCSGTSRVSMIPDLDELFELLSTFDKRRNCNGKVRRAKGETTRICGKDCRQDELVCGLYEVRLEFL